MKVRLTNSSIIQNKRIFSVHFASDFCSYEKKTKPLVWANNCLEIRHTLRKKKKTTSANCSEQQILQETTHLCPWSSWVESGFCAPHQNVNDTRSQVAKTNKQTEKNADLDRGKYCSMIAVQRKSYLSYQMMLQNTRMYREHCSFIINFVDEKNSTETSEHLHYITEANMCTSKIPTMLAMTRSTLV